MKKEMSNCKAQSSNEIKANSKVPEKN